MKLFRYIAVVLAISVLFFACGQKNPPAKEETPESPTKSSVEAAPVKPEPLAANEPDDSPIVVSSLTGTAQFRHTASGEQQPLTVGQVLVESDIITSGDGAVIVITLEEGKEIHLGGDTVFALSAIRRDSNGNVNILALKQGSIVNVVDTKLADNDIYEVHTPRLVMSVRGTSNYMETGADGDTVIGITGETHVFSNGDSFNVPQGSAVSQPEGAPPVIAPSDSESLPPLAASFASDRNITYPAISEDDLARSQQNAGSFMPSQDFEGTSSFSDALFNNPDITAPNSAPTPTAADEPQPVVQPVPVVLPPAPVAITPTPAASPQNPPSVESPASRAGSPSQENLSRWAGSSRNSSSSNDRSSSSSTPTPPPSPPAPPPQSTYDHIHIKYNDFSDGKAVAYATAGTTNNGYYRVAVTPSITSSNEVTKDMLPVPADYCVVNFTRSSRADGHILVDAKVILKNEPIVIRFYQTGVEYVDTRQNLSAADLFDVPDSVAAVVQQKFNNHGWSNLEIKETITRDSIVLYANGGKPATVTDVDPHPHSDGDFDKLTLWVLIGLKPQATPANLSVLLPEDSAEPPSEDSAEPPTEDSAEPPTEDSTEPPFEDSTEPPTEDLAEPPTEDSTEPALD